MGDMDLLAADLLAAQLSLHGAGIYSESSHKDYVISIDDTVDLREVARALIGARGWHTER